MARRYKCNPEITAKICGAIAAGNYAEVAAQLAGIHETTFYDWKRKGEAATSGRYYDFVQELKKAEIRAEAVRVKAIVDKGMEGNWTALAWWLERRFPDRWGRTRNETTIGNVTVNVNRKCDEDER